MRDRIAAAVIATFVALASCKRAPGGDRAQAPTVSPEQAAPAVPFEVRGGTPDLLFFWFDERGASHSTALVEAIPEARRALVRVDPTRPEMRAPGWVYVADLRTPSPQGTYPARAVRSEELSQQIMAMRGVQGPLGSQPPAPSQPTAPPAQVAQQGVHAQPAGSGVIVYGASWCSACHQAAAWLRGHNVAFVEKDIEQDASAQAEMVDKARRAGVPTGSIPIIDVRGHIMVGFSPPDIERALAGG